PALAPHLVLRVARSRWLLRPSFGKVQSLDVGLPARRKQVVGGLARLVAAGPLFPVLGPARLGGPTAFGAPGGSEESVEVLEEILEALAPVSPLVLHQTSVSSCSLRSRSLSISATNWSVRCWSSRSARRRSSSEMAW